MQSEKLGDHHEIVGTLVSVENVGECTKLSFSIRKTYEIPRDAIPVEKLKKAVGSRVGIFNCSNNYKMRMANKK